MVPPAMGPNVIDNEHIRNGTTISESNTYEKKSNKQSSTSSYQIKEKQSNGETIFTNIVWRNVIAFTLLHIAALRGIYILLCGKAWGTFILAYAYGLLAGFGITAGAHRLWSHKSYKATWQLRLILAIFNSMAFQNSIYEWVRDHRVHHKFTDSDADPHNIKRGFFFAHMGWLMVKKHSDVREKGKAVDMTDLEQDPIVMFQKKYYLWLMPIFAFILPTLLPYYCLNETLSNSFFVSAMLRYTMSLHYTWFVNSIAHIWGSKPYDKNIKSSNNLFVGIVANGEGWHNYHHVFPWDYKAAELGNYSVNLTLGFIDLFSKIGWAYDLKTVPEDMIMKRVKRTGDGSTAFSDCCKKITRNDVINNNLLEHDHEELIWGWDDKDLHDCDKKEALIINKTK